MRKLSFRIRFFVALLRAGLMTYIWANLMRIESPGANARLAIAKSRYESRAKAGLRTFLESPEEIKLATPRRKPAISILLVCWNKAEHTLLCLQSLAGHLGPPIEIIVVDNGSTDATSAVLARFPGLKILRLSENIGFLRAVNMGAQHAKGENLLLLNNDATLRAGALNAALRAIESSGDIGGVGGKIILPDGRLQEAGSIIWSNGICHGYRQGRSPDSFEVDYRRDVDYCSGAFLLVRRKLFGELGGFDEQFAPAYYEETDLCMRIRAAGYRVVYEPGAVIYHFEFGSAGSRKDARPAVERNRQVFVEKHKDALTRHYPQDFRLVLWARSRKGQKRVLLLWDTDATIDQPKILRELDCLRMQSTITLFLLETRSPITKSSEDWQPVEIETTRGSSSDLAGLLAARIGFYDSIDVRGNRAKAAMEHLLATAPILKFGVVEVIYR
jgi:O-antigen biosynthesis protein